MIKEYSDEKGFSLVELSVVLIILGLLAAGITAGNSLVKGSKLRAVVAEVESFKAAVNAFKIQYDDLPGDITNAHDYWDDGADGVCGTAAQCNGNGDTKINSTGGGNARETWRAWQHLTLAALVPGNYTGVAGSGGNAHAVIGQNVPASKIIGGGYTLLNINSYYGINKGNLVELGAESTNNRTYESLLSPRDASSIDKKVDDGLPEYGNVGGVKGNSDSGDNCIMGTSGDLKYELTFESKGCRMFFLVE